MKVKPNSDISFMRSLIISTVYVFGLFLSTQALAVIVDLSTFSVIQYNDGAQPQPANWILGAGNTSVTQTNNNLPSLFLSDFDAANKTLEWDARVNSTDDDSFGFAWGRQDFGNFYLLRWANSVTPSFVVYKLNDGANDPFLTPGGTTTLATSDTLWQNNTDYHFRLDFTSGLTEIDITQGAIDVASFTITDAAYTSGNFGFYTHSLGSVTFSNLSSVPVPPAVWLFGSGLLGLVGIARRKKAA